MKKSDLHEGQEVAIRVRGRIEHAVYLQSASTQGTSFVKLLTGQDRGAQKRLAHSLILSPWEESQEAYSRQQRREFQAEVLIAQQKYDQKLEIQELEAMQELLKLFGVDAGISQVYLPREQKYTTALLLPYRAVQKLKPVLTDMAAHLLKLPSP